MVPITNTAFCRTIKQIFEAQQRLKEKNWEYKLQVCDKCFSLLEGEKKQLGYGPFQASFLEIYNEEIRDLLAVEKDLKYEVKQARH